MVPFTTLTTFMGSSGLTHHLGAGRAELDVAGDVVDNWLAVGVLFPIDGTFFFGGLSILPVELRH